MNPLNLDPSEWLGDVWDPWTGGGSNDDGDQGGAEDQPVDDTEPDGGPWWRYRYGNDWITGREALRMAPMVSGPDVPTVEIRIYHDGVPKGAEVVAVVVEAALREGWGDRYEIDVSTRDDRVAVDDEEAWWSWVDNHDTAKDCNLLVGRSGGWAAHADLAGDTSSCHRGAEIAELHGSPLFVAGDGEGHKELSTGIHEVGHNLGLVHRMGGTVDGGVTPMGHYNSEGETYHHYFHPRTIRSDLQVS